MAVLQQQLRAAAAAAGRAATPLHPKQQIRAVPLAADPPWLTMQSGSRLPHRHVMGPPLAVRRLPLCWRCAVALRHRTRAAAQPEAQVAQTGRLHARRSKAWEGVSWRFGAAGLAVSCKIYKVEQQGATCCWSWTPLCGHQVEDIAWLRSEAGQAGLHLLRKMSAPGHLLQPRRHAAVRPAAQLPRPATSSTCTSRPSRPGDAVQQCYRPPATVQSHQLTKLGIRVHSKMPADYLEVLPAPADRWGRRISAVLPAAEFSHLPLQQPAQRPQRHSQPALPPAP